MIDFPVVLTAMTSNDAAEWRFLRLNQVFGFLAARIGKRVRYNLLALHDHKGHLTVTWNCVPDAKCVKAVADAWGGIVSCESDAAVDHEIRSN